MEVCERFVLCASFECDLLNVTLNTKLFTGAGGKLTKSELQEIETNMRELFDLCRICGRKGHFAMQCPDRKKQIGKKIEKKKAYLRRGSSKCVTL